MPRFLERLRARTGRNAASARRSQSRHCRPVVEALEERENPANLNFVPFSVVAANPSSLAPTSLLQFDPMPELGALPPAPGAFQGPIQVQGRFQQSLVAPAANSATAIPPAGHLDVTYALHGSDSGTVTAPGSSANQPGGLDATFNLTGRLTEVLYLPGPAPQSVWTISATITERGAVSGPLYTPQGGIELMNFNISVGLAQSEVRASAAASPGSFPWSVSATINSSGQFQLRSVPPPIASAAAALTVPFSVQDQIAESLSPTAGVPQPPIRISGVDNASGNVTSAFPPASPIVPPWFNGTTSYLQQLTEDITYPPGPNNPGSTQTVTVALDTSGVFQNLSVSPVAASAIDVGGADLTD